MPKVLAVLGDDVSTDVIYPGRYMATVLPGETPQYAFANDVALNAALRGGPPPEGSVIVAGKNFGCGSSREQAVSTLAGHGVTIVAEGIARIFLQNAVNLGLPVVIAPGIAAAVSEGDELAITDAAVTNRRTGRGVSVVPLPPSRRAILEAGGLVAYTRRRLVEAATR